MKNIDFSTRTYNPGDRIGNAEIIAMLGDSWNGRLDNFWHIQLQFRDALEKYLRQQGIKATCKVARGGGGVEICTANKALNYQVRRRKSGCRKIKKAMDGLQKGVDPNALTPTEVIKLDREQRIAVNQYLAVRRCNDYATLLSSIRSDEANRVMMRHDVPEQEP